MNVLEHKFLELQGNNAFFWFECCATLHLFMALDVISDRFLMPSIQSISSRYKLSTTLAGVLIAFGIAVPELVVTLISF